MPYRPPALLLTISSSSSSSSSYIPAQHNGAHSTNAIVCQLCCTSLPTRPLCQVRAWLAVYSFAATSTDMSHWLEASRLRASKVSLANCSGFLVMVFNTLQSDRTMEKRKEKRRQFFSVGGTVWAGSLVRHSVSRWHCISSFHHHSSFLSLF